MSLDLNSTVLDLIKAVNKASSVPVATSSALGGIKIGYSASGANIPVELSSVNQSAYVELTEAAITEALGYTPLNDESISITSTLTSGTEIGSIKVGDTTTKLYAPTATAVDFAGLDVWAGGVSSIEYTGVEDGITWEDTFAFTDSNGFSIHEGTYYGKIPIVPGDNVTFTVNEEAQVVQINATGGGSSGGGSNVIRRDWINSIESLQDLCFLIPDYGTNEKDFVGEVELWIENIDADWGELSLFEGITAENQLNSDNMLSIPDDCITMYIKFSFVDDYIIVQGNDTHGMSYTCGFARPIEKPSGRLFSIAIAPTGSGRFAIIGRTVEYL